MMPRPRKPQNADLPLGVYVGKSRYFYRPPKMADGVAHKDVYLCPADADIDEVMQVFSSYQSSRTLGMKPYVRAFHNSRKNALSRNIPFELTRDDLVDLVDQHNHRCAITKIFFNEDRPVGSRRRPWAPSIDRIDSSGIYRMENVRLVCVSVNLAMNEWGATVSKTIAHNL